MTNRNGGNGFRYEVATYLGVGSEPETKSVTGPVLNTIDLRPFAHVVWHSRGSYGFRDAAGQWMQRPIRKSGMGPVCLAIIEAIQRNPGVMLTCEEIADLTGNKKLANKNTLCGRLVFIRRAHLETPEQPRFFPIESEPYAVMWPAQFNWISIRRSLPPCQP